MCALLLLTISATMLRVQATGSDEYHFRVGVVAGESSRESVAHLSDMLRHSGYPYYSVTPGSQISDLNTYSLLIIFESGLSKLGENTSESILNLSGRRNLLWIGHGIGALDRETLSKVFGLRYVSESLAETFGVAFASSSSRRTRIFNELVTHVEVIEARVEACFLDITSRRLFPSETHLRLDTGTISYFFAYDVSNWWNVDPESPWSRPALLSAAIRFVSSNTPGVLLRPYPRNLNSVFICRIEDVDPLHTSAEWLERAHGYLQEYRARRVPLSVALVPVYMDPVSRLEIRLSEESANPVSEWLNAVIRGRGVVVQHGLTHQHANWRTGVGTEFLVNGSWMEYEDQQRRISVGKIEIEDVVRSRVLAFEAPHYKSNDDTLRALLALGFRCVFDDHSSPFFAFWFPEEHGRPSLVLVPETLGYIPLGSTLSMEDSMRRLVDELAESGGILLLYNHLYDDVAFTIGIRTMEYALQKGSVWTANVNEITNFALERARSYSGFSVEIGPEITVRLGPCAERGLTLLVNGKERIGWVRVNGKEWPLFAENYVILPELPADSNTVVIGFKQQAYPQWKTVLLGLGLVGVVTCTVLPISRRVFGGE